VPYLATPNPNPIFVPEGGAIPVDQTQFADPTVGPTRRVRIGDDLSNAMDDLRSAASQPAKAANEHMEALFSWLEKKLDEIAPRRARRGDRRAVDASGEPITARDPTRAYVDLDQSTVAICLSL